MGMDSRIYKNRIVIEFKKPIPVIIKENGKEAMGIYVVHGGTFENDLWTVALCDGGDIITVRIDQIKMYTNKTFDINGQATNTKTKKIRNKH
jgi:hypothetical protein